MTDLNPQGPDPLQSLSETSKSSPSEAPATSQAPTRASSDLGDFATSARAAAAEDYDSQVRSLKMGELEILARGGDPVHEMTVGQAATSPAAQLAYIAGQQNQRYMEIRTAADSAGWGQLYGFMKMVTDQYRAENSAPLAKLHEHSTPEEHFKLQQQLRPMEVDPNQVAQMRQLATQIDTAIRAVDPEASFWTHPDFKDVAGWLNREAGSGTQGFMTSGPQDLPAGATASAAVLGGGEAATDMGLGIAYTAWSWGADGLNAMGIEAPQPPTNYLIDPKTGQLIVNTARPNPGLIETVVSMRAQVMGKDVMEEITKLHGARHLEEIQRSGVGNTLVVGAQLVGMVGLPAMGKFKGMAGGFAPAIKAMQSGTLLGQRLVHKGLVKLGGRQTLRTQKIIMGIGGVVGAGAGNGIVGALAYGRHDDYVNQAVHGFVLAPVLMGMGALGSTCISLGARIVLSVSSVAGKTAR